MAKPKLSETEWSVLRDVTELHEAGGHVLLTSGIKPDELEAVGALVLRGLLEIRATAKNQGYDERRVVPTAVGRRLIHEVNTADAVAGRGEEMAA